MIVSIKSVFSQNRVTQLLEGLHRQFPAFGTIKAIDFEDQSVLVQQGSLYHHTIHTHHFKIIAGRLIYRHKRRAI